MGVLNVYCIKEGLSLLPTILVTTPLHPISLNVTFAVLNPN